MMAKNNKDKITTASSSASATTSTQTVSIAESAVVSSSVSTTTQVTNIPQESDNRPSVNAVEWTEYVLGLLTDDEKIKGNPTTD